MSNKELLDRSGKTSTEASTKAAFNWSNKDRSSSFHTYSEWCATEHAFALICTHLHICSIQKSWKQTNKHGKHIYMTCIYDFKAPYLHICHACMPCIYAYMVIYTLVYSPSCIYIYTYIHIYIYIYIYAAWDPKTPRASHCRCRKLQLAWHNDTTKSSRSYYGFLSRNISIMQAQSRYSSTTNCW